MTTRLPASFWSRAALSRVIGAHQRRQQTITAPWHLEPISLSTNSHRLFSSFTVRLGRQNPSNPRLFKNGLVDDQNASARYADTQGWKKTNRRKEEGDGAKSSGLKLRTRTVSSKALAQELRWLKDPRDFANRVALILQTGDFDFALKLVERGVRERMGCDVAWNHVLQRAFHEMTPKAVFKLYNDVSLVFFPSFFALPKFCLELTHSFFLIRTDEEGRQQTKRQNIYDPAQRLR
jgi:hypothetical protein